MYWGRRVTCIHLKNGLFFERDADGGMRIVQRENESLTSHTYFIIELTHDEWCKLVDALCCEDASCGVSLIHLRGKEKNEDYPMPELKRLPIEG